MRLAPRPSPMPRFAALRSAAIALLLALPLAGCVASTSNGSGGTHADASKADEPMIETGTAPPPPDMVAPATPPATDASGQPLIEQRVANPPLSNDAVPAPSGDAPGSLDYTCTTDADCAVKDVGSCCGYAPACVNVNSPTFPEQVKAECAKNDMQSICGFREIAGCTCVEGRCTALGDGEGPVR